MVVLLCKSDDFIQGGLITVASTLKSVGFALHIGWFSFREGKDDREKRRNSKVLVSLRKSAGFQVGGDHGSIEAQKCWFCLVSCCFLLRGSGHGNIETQNCWFCHVKLMVFGGPIGVSFTG